MRDENPTHKYEREKVLASVEKLDSYFSLFGGEALLIGLKNVEELLRIAFERFGYSGIQTNGNLITEKHIDLFAKYNTTIGISLDGGGELNDIRWAGSLEATRKLTDRTMWAIRRLCERSATTPSLLPSLIVTLHAGNCAADKFPKFVAWLRELDEMGIKWVNLHTMEMDFNARDWALPEQEYADRLIDLWKLEPEFKNLRFSKFKEILELLQGNDANAVCVWHACDPWNTDAVQGVESDGSPSHCSRTNKDGTNWLPAEGSGVKSQHTTFIGHPGTRHYERQLALYVTPQEVGGCKDCPFWLICQGNCPGEGETGDWRMRSSHCGIYKRLFAYGEQLLRAEGKQPISDWEHRKDLEARMYQLWATNQTAYLGNVIAERNRKDAVPTDVRGYHADGIYVHGDADHGDHIDTAHSDQPLPNHGDSYEHGDRPHGDAPHGDSGHGDHNDASK